MQKRTPYRNKKILEAARGAPCMLNGPWCNHDPETTVFAHLNYSWAGKGLGQKSDDFAGFFGCSDCHRWYDEYAGNHQNHPLYAFRAVIKTWRWLLDHEVLR